jgi:hypothetical protein
MLSREEFEKVRPLSSAIIASVEVAIPGTTGTFWFKHQSTTLDQIQVRQ